MGYGDRELTRLAILVNQAKTSLLVESNVIVLKDRSSPGHWRQMLKVVSIKFTLRIRNS